MSRITRIEGVGPQMARPLARSIALGAFLALTGVNAPALHAQADCEDVSGAWLVAMSLPGGGPTEVTITLEQADCEVSGIIEGRRETPFEGGKVEGSTATFTANATNQADGSSIAIVWEATVEGDEISGTLQAALMGTVTFTGTRVEG